MKSLSSSRKINGILFPRSKTECLELLNCFLLQSSDSYINILLFRDFSWGPSQANPARKSAISAQVICLSHSISCAPKHGSTNFQVSREILSIHSRHLQHLAKSKHLSLYQGIFGNECSCNKESRILPSENTCDQWTEQPPSVEEMGQESS